MVRERTRARAAVIRAADPHLLRPGEDRLRATLVLLSAQVGAYRLEQLIHVAAAIGSSTPPRAPTTTWSMRRSAGAARPARATGTTGSR